MNFLSAHAKHERRTRQRGTTRKPPSGHSALKKSKRIGDKAWFAYARSCPLGGWQEFALGGLALFGLLLVSGTSMAVEARRRRLAGRC